MSLVALLEQKKGSNVFQSTAGIKDAQWPENGAQVPL
jgi:hypothetical protein